MEKGRYDLHFTYYNSYNLLQFYFYNSQFNAKLDEKNNNRKLM